jgi:hypothetical protein
VERVLVPFDRVAVDPASSPASRAYAGTASASTPPRVAGCGLVHTREPSGFPFVEPDDIQQALAYAAALQRGEETTAASGQSLEHGW